MLDALHRRQQARLRKAMVGASVPYGKQGSVTQTCGDSRRDKDLPTICNAVPKA